MVGVSIHSKADVGLQEVEPYIPFNINPTGMQPVLTTTYLMAVPSLIAKYDHRWTSFFSPNSIVDVQCWRICYCFDSRMANDFDSFTRAGGFWHQLRSTLNPAWPPAPGASPLVYYGLNALFIFIFNILDIVSGISCLTLDGLSLGKHQNLIMC